MRSKHKINEIKQPKLHLWQNNRSIVLIGAAIKQAKKSCKPSILITGVDERLFINEPQRLDFPIYQARIGELRSIVNVPIVIERNIFDSGSKKGFLNLN